MGEILEQYRIADFLDWYNEKRLVLNPEFQRGPVWTPAARVYLIDTILRGYPVPKLYMRTTLDVKAQKSVREVVDGQQRLRAIMDFAHNKLRLSKRAGEFEGMTYDDLNADQQEHFLGYPLSVGQLLSAQDDEVLEVFARLNSYGLSLNPAEKRHAKYTGEFKWAVRSASRRWTILWDEYKVVTTRQRVRMQDDSLMAEMFGVVLNGVTDGGQPRIDKLYGAQDEKFDAAGPVPATVDAALTFFVDELGELLEGTALVSAPHFLMLFAALTHAQKGIPAGDMGDQMPERRKDALSEMSMVRSNLLQLAAVIESDDPVRGYEDFWRRSQKSTQRIASRRVRFPILYAALGSEAV